MTQLFRDTEYNIRFDRWTATVKNLQGAMAWRMHDEILTSKTMGYFIWDNVLSDLVPFFSREYFAENWEAIINAFARAGTFESYILVIQSALGAGTAITFVSPEPSHLQINIAAPTGIAQWVAYTNNENQNVIPDQLQYPDSTLVFEQGEADLTISETIKLIELLNVNGVLVETFFV